MANLSSGISQKDYLQKYLTGKNVDKKKKKRKISKKATEKRSVVVDDDEIKTMRELADGELDIFSMSEDAPQIAGIIDERPEELRTIETFRSSARWKVISDEYGIEDIQVVAVPSDPRPSADSDDDFSPARNTRDDSDESPPRKKISPPRSKGRNVSDSDESPPRVKSQSRGKQPRNGNDIRDSLHGSRNASDPKQSLSNDSRWGKRESRGDSPPRREYRKDADCPGHSRHDKGHFEETSSRRRGGSPPRPFPDSRQETRLNSDIRRTNQRLDGREQISRITSQQAKERSQIDAMRGNIGDSLQPVRIKKEPVSPLRKDAFDAKPRNTAKRSSRKDRESSAESLGRIKKNISCDSGDSDESPPRKYHKKTVNKEFVDKSRSRKDKHRVGKDSDRSPPRKSKTTTREIAKESSRKSSKHAREASDESPPRKSKTSSRDLGKESSIKSSKHAKEDSDESPPRKSKTSSRDLGKESSIKSSKHAREDSDESPPRISKTTSREIAKESSRKSSKQAREDSDESPPRKSKTTSREGNEASSKQASSRRGDRQDTTKSSSQNSSGTSRADGSGQLEEDRTKDFKMGESEAQTAPIYRDRKTGRKRDLAAEQQQRKEESAKTDVTKEKYTRWGAGLTQVAERESRTRDALREASKPVARFADDADLDAMLRARDREGDPMLEYLKGKSTDVSVPSKPRYAGSFPPNRYGIAPGHRWDGVDRSTGFERRWFEGAAARQAVAEDAYKWSVADM